MTIETVEIESISPDPANARKHGAKNLEAIKGSLRRFGQQKPIVVDSRGIVRAGNGTLSAARALGWSRIQIVRSDLPAAELTAYSVADNRSAELAEWDMQVLGQLAADGELGGVGFDDDELRKLMGEEPPVNPGEAETPGGTFEVVVECGDEAAQKQLFERLSGEGFTCRLFTL